MEYNCPFCNSPFIAELRFSGQVVACPHCGGHIQLPTNEFVPVHVIPPPKPKPPLSLVNYNNDGSISVNCNTVPQAKLALKELKLKKKELNLLKRQVNQEQKAIRADYTNEVRQRGSKVRGGGKVGSFFRTMQTISRDSRRAQLADDLAPLEDQKQRIEAMKNAIDQVILQVEQYIAFNS